MAINKKLIHFEKRENFDTRLANNEINNTSIVFIQDTGELWTHGQFFCTTATNLLEAPSLLTVGDTIAVQIGDKTSNYIVPPAAQKGRTMYECITDTADTRGHWTGTIPGVTELYDGLVIHVRFTTTYYGNGEGYNTLNINNLGHKLIWYRYNTILTTHWGSNAEVTLTYRTTAGSYKVSKATGELTNGTTYTDGWVADYAYYSDSNWLATAYYFRFKVHENGYLGRYMLVMKCPNGTITGLSTNTTTNGNALTNKPMFTGPLLIDNVFYYRTTTAFAANAVLTSSTDNQMCENYGAIDARYTFNCGTTLTANKPFFIVGSIGEDGYFHLDVTQPWALEYPTTEDNKIYIYVGYTYSTYQIWLDVNNPAYIYKNGKVQLYSQYASETEWANITGKPSTFTPSTHTHSYTDLTGSTTTADQAIVSSGTANGWTLKTLGSHAFDSTAYLPLTGGTLTGVLTVKPTNTSSYQEGIVLHDLGAGASEGLWIKWTSNTYTDGIKLMPNSDKTELCINNVNNKIWHAGNDGADSGLNADLLDGKHASEFSLSGHTHAWNSLTRDSTTAGQVIVSTNTANGWELKTLGSHAFDSTEYVTLSTDQTISGVKTFKAEKFKLSATENNGITDYAWNNGTYYKSDDSATVTSLSAIRRAFRFRWYNTYYDIGVIRSGSQDAYGFGIGVENADNTHVLDLLRVSTTGTYILGNLALHASNYTTYTVKKDGTGATGTWGIDITGSSASCTGNSATATEFASVQSVTLTGDTTGTTSSKAGWSIATTTKYLTGFQRNTTDSATAALTTTPGNGKIIYNYNVLKDTTGLFANVNNANSILTINKHPGNYDSQLGFSSNGNIYYRSFGGTALNTTQSWKQIAFTDSDITGQASYAANVGSAGTVGTNYVAASKVIAACNWYDTVTGSDTDSVINRWDEIVNFVAGFEETPDLATYLENNYLAKTGNSTASPMTGTIYVKDVNPLVLQSTNQDLDIWRVTGNTTGSLWDNTFGFYLRYNGTGQGNDNSLSLWSNNQTGNDIEVYRVKQDGILNFLKAPTINGTAISLTTHDHDDRYLKLIGGTLTGTLNLDSNTMGAVAHLTFNREYSYIQNKASSGKFVFLANNAAAGSSANADLIIADGSIYPGTSGHTSLGLSTSRFNQLHLNGALTAYSTVYFKGLTEGTSDVTDDTELVTSYADTSGFANANGAGQAYRRKATKLYNYIKGKTDSLYLPLSGGTMTGPINWGTGATREILQFSTNSTWKSGLRYSWNSNTTVALWGKQQNTQFVWNAGSDAELNGTTTKTYDFQVGRDTSGTYNGKVVGRIAGNIIWHADNDGSDSGLDADLLDGQHGSYYLKEANLEWGGKNFSGTYGPVDAAMINELGANRAAFAKAAGIAVEYSRDGGETWIDYGLTDVQKIGIFSTSTGIVAGKRTTNDVVGVNDQVRVRLLTSAAGIYTVLNKFTIYLSTGGSTGCWCTIKARKQTDYENGVETYTTYASNVPVSGWSGWNVINTNGITTYGNTKTTQNGELIFIFGVTGYNGNGTTQYGLNISKIRCFGGQGWTTPSNMARDGHLYSYDNSQNATFPAQITATAFKKSGGTSSQFLKADGSVDTNTYATTSHNHDSTYLKLSGGTTTGAINYGVTSGAYDTTQGINFGTISHIGTSTGLGLYSTGSIFIRPNQPSLSSVNSYGLVVSSTEFTYNNTNVSLEGHTHSEYVTSVAVTDDETNHANQLRYVKNGVSTYFTVPYATKAGKTGAYLTNSSYTIASGKGKEITLSSFASILISGSDSQSGGRFFMWFGGYGATSVRCTCRVIIPGKMKYEYTSNESIILYNNGGSEAKFTITCLMGSYTVGTEVDAPESFSTQSIVLCSDTWSSYLNTTLNSTYVLKAGDTMTGDLIIDKESTYASPTGYISGLTVKANGHQLAFGFGTGGVNRGITDKTKAKWLIYTDNTDTLLQIGNVKTAADIIAAGKVCVGTGGTNSFIGSDSASNVYLHNSSGYVLVVDGLAVRCASTTADATLGTSARPWNSLYVNTININSNKGGAEHINFNRAGYNYVNIPTNGTFAVSFNTSTIANSYFTVEQSATYPGQHNGTVDLGTSSYQWNNLYAKTIYQNGSSINSLYVTLVGVADDSTNHANQLRYVVNGTSNYFTVPFATNATNATNATSATTAANLNKSTLGYLYQSATTTTGSTGTVTATSGKIGVPIQFYGSQVNYALNNDLFYATVASNAITANTIYLGDDIKSKTFVKTSTHVPTGASSGSSSSGTSGESITYTAGNGIKIAGTQISTNTWTGTESQFAELANPSSYDLIYIIED